LKASGKLSLLQNDFLVNQLYKFYNYYDSRVANFNQLPMQTRFDLRRTQSKIMHLEDIERYHDSNYSMSPGKEFFFDVFENEEIPGLLREIIISSHFNIRWFEELLLQSQGIIRYMEENIPELREVNSITPAL